MGKRGPKPKSLVKIEWSDNFAYAIGLLTSDGNLSPDGRHITFTSKDVEQVENFMKALDIDIHIGSSISGYKEGRTPRVQFGDVLFYDFLVSIGLMSNKSKIINEVAVPSKYFFHFLRGTFDGDGSVHSYFDPRFKSSFMCYTMFASASERHIHWLQKEIYNYLKIKGHISKAVKNSAYQLKYAKAESLQLWKRMYASSDSLYLKRKYLKIKENLRIIAEHQKSEGDY
jgi:hypothetical protein